MIITLLIILFIPIYFLFTIVLTLIQVNRKFKEPVDGIDIYLVSNGVHTDLVLPLNNHVINWSNQFPSNEKYISFGWGDKGFYLNTPRWRDLKFTTAIKALFYLGSSVMHVTHRSEISGVFRKIRITQKQYFEMVNMIDDSFKIVDGKLSFIQKGFYDAKGKYNMFFTCNCYVNRILKKIGVKTCVWAPFDKCLFYCKKWN